MTGDHLVPVGGSDAASSVTVVSGDAVNFSMDRTRSVVGTIGVGETVDFDVQVWLWSPSLSAVRVESAKHATLNDLLGRIADVEQRPNPHSVLAKFLEPEPKRVDLRTRLLLGASALSMACSSTALALTLLH